MFISKDNLKKSYKQFWDKIAANPNLLNDQSTYDVAVEVLELGIKTWGKDALIKAEENGGKRIQDNSEAKSENLLTLKGADGVSYKVDWRAGVALGAMAKEAYADGISTDLLKLTSGYRSDASQKPLWDAKVAEIKAANPTLTDAQVESAARVWVAKPGTSRHRSGRAIDLKMDPKLRNRQADASALKKTKTFKWMEKNAATYGFYNYEKEPWHWEYNP